MSNIKLKDVNGDERRYDDVTHLKVKGVDGSYITFTEGEAPSGKINITNTSEYDVAHYARAQVMDNNLVAENIAKDVTVLGITGTHEGGSEPAAYLKNATVDGNTLTITKKDDSTVTYTPTEQYQGTVTSVAAGTGLSVSGTSTVNPTVNVASGYKLPTTAEWGSKINEPASEGSNGQVLTTDGNGGRTWSTVTEGGELVDLSSYSAGDVIPTATIAKLREYNVTVKYNDDYYRLATDTVAYGLNMVLFTALNSDAGGSGVYVYQPTSGGDWKFSGRIVIQILGYDADGVLNIKIENTDKCFRLSYSGEVTVIKKNSEQSGDINLTLPPITGVIALKSDINNANIIAGLGYTPYNATNPNGYISGITSKNVTDALGYTPYNSTNPAGYISGISSKNVTDALGYTPYNSTNPAGYITGIDSSDVTTALGYTPMDAALKGANSGVAELGADGKVPTAQLPSFVDDVIEGYYYNNKFYSDSAHTQEITPESGKIYVDLHTNKTYRWGGSTYVEISASLALGETSTTAYRGDRGKTAYDHSQATHARTDATAVSASSTNGNIKINGTETTVYTHPGSGTNPHGTTRTDLGLSNVENKSSATIRSEITDSNVTTALGYTPYDAANPAGYITGITGQDVSVALGYTPYDANNPNRYISGISGSDVTTALGYTPYNSTNPNNYISGISGSDVTGALGYVPYDSTNPNNYISGISSADVTDALGYVPYNSANPSNYVDQNVSNLTNYYTKTAVDGMVANRFQALIVETLPTSGISTSTIYMVRQTGQTDIYDEWMYISNTWTKIGTTSIDMSDYAKKTELHNVATTGAYSSLVGKPDIPDDTSDLTNGAGFVTKSVNNLDNYTKTTDLAAVALTGSYNDLTGKPTIPSALGTLTNDVGYIKQSDLATTNISSLYNDVPYATLNQIQGLEDIDVEEIKKAIAAMEHIGTVTQVTAGTGLTGGGNTSVTLNHANSVTAKSGYPTGTTLENGGSFTVRDAQYDAQGHITGTQDRTITMTAIPPYDDTTVKGLISDETDARELTDARVTALENFNGATFNAFVFCIFGIEPYIDPDTMQIVPNRYYQRSDVDTGIFMDNKKIDIHLKAWLQYHYGISSIDQLKNITCYVYAMGDHSEYVNHMVTFWSQQNNPSITSYPHLQQVGSFIDDGYGSVHRFTTNQVGAILSSSDDGYIAADPLGTGKGFVSGWNTLKERVSTVESGKQDTLTASKNITIDASNNISALKYYKQSEVTGVAGTSTTQLSSTYDVTDASVTSYYDGMVVTFVLPVAGIDKYGSVFQFNSLGYKPIVYGANSIVSTRYPVGGQITMVYNSVQTATAYLTKNTPSTSTGCWQLCDYDADTKNYADTICETAAATAAKTASHYRYVATANSYCIVTTRYANSAKSALTLNINSTGAKPIYINGTASSSSNYTLPAATYLVYYDGTNYYFNTNGKIPGNVGAGTVTSVGAGTGLSISGTASVNPTVNVASTHKLPTTSEWSGKQDNLTAGTNIQINGTTISATDTTYTAGTNITIDENNVISATGGGQSIQPLYTYSGTFSAAHQELDTNIALTANTTYIFKLTSAITAGAIKTYISGKTNHFTRVFSGNKMVCFRPTVSGNLVLYNTEAYSSGTAYTGAVNLEIYAFTEDNAHELDMPTEYVVDLEYNADANYNSFTQCIMDLLDDERKKTIYLHGGDYNIFEEYHAFGMPVYTGTNWTEDYPDYCAHIPTNAHIIGQGIVKIIWMPDPATTSITLKESWTVAPINVFGSCILENFEIYCKNGRYCIHDDPLGDIRYTGATKIYKGLKCYRYTNDTDPTSGDEYGFNYTIGFGMDSSMHFEFIDCLLQNFETNVGSFYMHDRCLLNKKQQLVPTNESSDILVKNCIILTNNNSASAPDMYAVELYNERPMYNTATGEIVDAKWSGEAYNNKDMPIRHIRVYFESTYIDGKVALFGTKGGGVNTCYNGYDLTFVNCNNVEVYYDDVQHNQFPPKFYNTDEQVIKVDTAQTTLNLVAAPNFKYVYNTIDTLNLTFAPGVPGAQTSVNFVTGFVPTIVNITGDNIATDKVFSDIDPYSEVCLKAKWVNGKWAIECTQERLYKLNSDYQELKYIEGVTQTVGETTTGSSIDLGFNPADNYQIYMRYTLGDVVGEGGFIFGCYRQDASGENVYENCAFYVSKRLLENGKENYTISFYTGTAGFKSSGGYCHEYHDEQYMNIYVLNTGRLYIGDTYNTYNNFKHADVTQTTAVPVSLVINGVKDNINGISEGFCKERMFRFSYKDSSRELYLIPVLNKCNGKVGLYDLINSTFYTTADGVLSFNAGPAIDEANGEIAFNSAYDHISNKAATMLDITNVVGQINTVLDTINGEVI